MEELKFSEFAFIWLKGKYQECNMLQWWEGILILDNLFIFVSFIIHLKAPNSLMSWKLCEMKHQWGHDAIWRGVCHDPERISRVPNFFFIYYPNTTATFQVHGITSQYCSTLSSIGLNVHISCSIRSDELANCQNSSDVWRI